MNEQDKQLARIADALERLAPRDWVQTDWHAAPAYVWQNGGASVVETIEAPALDLLRGIDRQKAAVVENVRRIAQGHAAHDMLLWGSRGMGKSALIRSAVAAEQVDNSASIALVQAGPQSWDHLNALFAQLAFVERNFLILLDDFGFEEGDATGPRQIRSWLEGGIETRAPQIRLAVTANRRSIVARNASEQADPLNPRDEVDDMLALADRFGLSLGFHNCTQDDYLEIVRGYAEAHNLSWEKADALEWAKRRGARSGRTAWHYIVELAGRAGRAL